jgi:AraC-like DNA-binding protein
MDFSPAISSVVYDASMKTDQRIRQSSRMQADREELADRIAAWATVDGAVEPQPGLRLGRRSVAGERDYGVFPPAFCVIAQGSKNIGLGERLLRYDPAHYLITTMDLPLSWEVVEASRERPYLSFALRLDPAVVTSIIVESGVAESRGEGAQAAEVSPLDEELLGATLRLVRLLDSPADYRVVAPLVIREIVYRLLKGTEGERLRHMARFAGQSHRMVRAIEALRANFDKPLRIEDVARELDMSVSSFHAHFKAATTMSPLQFQKQLRLQEARRVMLSENLDAVEAGYRVGYDDASHFSREYKRHFGEPPVRDVERLRELAGVRASSK